MPCRAVGPEGSEPSSSSGSGAGSKGKPSKASKRSRKDSRLVLEEFEAIGPLQRPSPPLHPLLALERLLGAAWAAPHAYTLEAAGATNVPPSRRRRRTGQKMYACSQRGLKKSTPASADQALVSAMCFISQGVSTRARGRNGRKGLRCISFRAKEKPLPAVPRCPKQVLIGVTGMGVTVFDRYVCHRTELFPAASARASSSASPSSPHTAQIDIPDQPVSCAVTASTPQCKSSRDQHAVSFAARVEAQQRQRGGLHQGKGRHDGLLQSKRAPAGRRMLPIRFQTPWHS